MKPAGERPVDEVPRLAIVVPLKDEAEGVPSLLAALDALVVELRPVARCEFVFVDDGTRDATAALLTAAVASRPHARLVRHERNRGIAAAIRTGLQTTDAPVVASIDIFIKRSVKPTNL